MNLEDWRREIDEIDKMMVRLLNKRAKIARKIGRLKASAGLPVIDDGREREILLKVAGANDEGLLKREAIIRIFRAVIRESRNVQAETSAGAKQIL